MGDGGDTLSNHPNKKEIYKKSAEGNKIALQNMSKEKKKEKALKCSISNKGKECCQLESWKENQRRAQIGLKRSKETRRKVSEATTGEKKWIL